MKPFDLEAARRGAKVCTRQGLDAEIVSWNLKRGNNSFLANISCFGKEHTVLYDERGHADNYYYDLFMKTANKITKWVIVHNNLNGNIYACNELYDSEEEALSKTISDGNYHIAKVEWEENL